MPRAGIACRCLACRPQRRRRKLKRATAPSFWLLILIKARARFAHYILDFRYHVEQNKRNWTAYLRPADIIKIRCNSRGLANSKESRCEHGFLHWLLNLYINKRKNLANATHGHQILSKYINFFLCFKFLAKNTMSLWKALPQRKPRLQLRTLKLISLNGPTTKTTNATATTADAATCMRYVN